MAGCEDSDEEERELVHGGHPPTRHDTNPSEWELVVPEGFVSVAIRDDERELVLQLQPVGDLPAAVNTSWERPDEDPEIGLSPRAVAFLGSSRGTPPPYAGTPERRAERAPMVGFRLGGGTLVSGAAARLDSPPTDPPRSPEGEAPGSPGHPFGSPFFCSDNECAICLGSLRGPTPFPSEECPHVYCADCLEKLQAHQPRAAMLCPQVFLRTQNDGFTLKLLDLILTTTLWLPTVPPAGAKLGAAASADTG